MTQAQLGRVVGRDRTSLTRGLDPDTKPGELALMLIRCYHGLYALVGGNTDAIRHWMQSITGMHGAFPPTKCRPSPG